jgi:hypothetical protein
MGACTIKRTAHDPCLVLNQNYTNFEFCEEIAKMIQKNIDLQSQAKFDEKQIPRKVHIF